MAYNNQKLSKKQKRELKKKDKGIVDLMRIIHHFFDDLPAWIEEMTDPRCLPYCTYTQSDYVYMGIMKNLCGQVSMNSMEEMFNEENCIDTLKILTGDKNLNEMPHKDSLNYYLEKLSPLCLSELRKKMIKRLIRMKTFNRSKLLGKYWRIVIDGTDIHYYKEKPDEHCLVTNIEKDGKKITCYYHKVLEAKLILHEDIIISIDTEFIENEDENVSKQDCETNAAKRLVKRIKKNYPRLDICIQGDALYATEPFMKICREYGWKYLFTEKQERQPIIVECYDYIRAGGECEAAEGICKENGTGRYSNGVEITAGKCETANIFEYEYTLKDKEGQKKQIRFLWVTNIELKKKILEEMINAGRGRWKIENEGFNNQKNGIYEIEHLNSRNYNAIKNHYLLTQIADIIFQLYYTCSAVIRELSQSRKNTSSWLLESFRRQKVTDEDVSFIVKYTTVYLE